MPSWGNIRGARPPLLNYWGDQWPPPLPTPLNSYVCNMYLFRIEVRRYCLKSPPFSKSITIIISWRGKIMTTKKNCASYSFI